MKIVVDTNIIFSTLFNSNSTIEDLLFNSDKHFEFYSCNYMRFEIKKHWERLKKISKLSEEQLQVSYTQVLTKIKFVNEEIIPV
jgi:predicted nucleic acid-binding protein